MRATSARACSVPEWLERSLRPRIPIGSCSDQRVRGCPRRIAGCQELHWRPVEFRYGAEMERSEGIPVELVLVDDDVTVEGNGHSRGARGLAATIFIHKLVAAAAAEGKSLGEVAAIGRAAVESLATMGVHFPQAFRCPLESPVLSWPITRWSLGLVSMASRVWRACL
jgi:hypothetical protein